MFGMFGYGCFNSSTNTISVVKETCGQRDPIEVGFYWNAYFVIIDLPCLPQINSLELVRNYTVI